MNDDVKIPVPKRKPEVPEWFPLVNEGTIQFAEDYEEAVPHLYKDTEDKITVGIGFNVNDKPKEAYDLGLYWADGRNVTDRRATQKEVEIALDKIKSLPKGKPYTSYDPLTPENQKIGLLNIRMGPDKMRQEVEKKLKQSERELSAKIPNFKTIPYPARKALLDMQYNIGDRRFRYEYLDDAGQKNGWPNLFKAIDARDWKTAADESRRGQVGEKRNEAIRQLFLEAYNFDQRGR